MKRKAYAGSTGGVATMALSGAALLLVLCAVGSVAARGVGDDSFALTGRRAQPECGSLGTASAVQGEFTDGCRDYRAYLGRARSYLERGDRAGALAELRRARAALRSCLRDDAPEVVAVA